MLSRALQHILSCDPSPVEILIHVDAGDEETENMLDISYTGTSVRWISSMTTQGPGGGRNLLMKQALADIIVSLDDDSWPIDSDFFARAVSLLNNNPEVAILAASVTARGEILPDLTGSTREVGGFENCGCVMRRNVFLNTSGYLALRFAYGMEESDLALQIQDQGWKILRVPCLRVFHDTDLGHHVGAALNAAQIANIGLLAFLRYPKRYWPFGTLQVLNRVRYCLGARRLRGIIWGLVLIPILCIRYRASRKAIKPFTMRYNRLIMSA